MAPSFPDHLRDRLLDAGVRPRLVDRIVGELADHAVDLRRELEASGLAPHLVDAELRSRLGTSRAIVTAVLADRATLSLGRRLPGLVFGVGPFVAAAFAYAFLSAAAIGDSALADRLSVVVWPIVVGAFCTLARRQRCQLRWPALATVLTTMIGSLFMVSLHLPQGARPGFLCAVLSTHGAEWRAAAPIAMLAIYALAHVRAARQRNLVVTASLNGTTAAH